MQPPHSSPVLGRTAACLLALVVVAAMSACNGQEPLSASVGGRPVHTLVHDGALRVGVYENAGGRPCFAYAGSRSGGGSCMVAVGKGGWALELAVADPGPRQVLLIAAIRRATTVRIPRTGGGWLTVHPHLVAGFPEAVAVLTDIGELRLTGNLAEAFDASGKLLGHTHDCAGLGGPPDCGPYTGLLDRPLRPATTPS